MKRILLQKGHWPPREVGFEGGTGASGEQEVVGVLVDRTFRKLMGDPRFSPRICPGAIPADVKSGADKIDVFISFHCDGSSDSNRSGWGIGYPDHPVNRNFARILGEEISRIPHRSGRLRDNYTSNMSGYYGYSRVPTPGPEVLVEHGFSSNPAEKRWMLDNAHKFADAYHRALCRLFGFPVRVLASQEEDDLTAEQLSALEKWAAVYVDDKEAAKAVEGVPRTAAGGIVPEGWALVRARLAERANCPDPDGEAEVLRQKIASVIALLS